MQQHKQQQREGVIMQHIMYMMLLALLLLPSCISDKKDPRTCGNREGAICCQAWGNTCKLQ
jgi:hypothetical protein